MKENRQLFIGIGIGMIFTWALISLFMHSRHRAHLTYQKMQSARHDELVESIRQSGLVSLMSNVLNKIDDELKNNPKRILSDETIGRIAALSYSFISHEKQKSDSASAKVLSPERGELLLMLSKMNLDSGSIKKIMVLAPFAGAVLRDADLMEANLKAVNLNGADLKNANLQGANLYEAEMRSADLWGANLSKANLGRADLKTSDMRWTVLNGAHLSIADLQGADMSSSQLRQADLRGAYLQWADLSGAILHETDMTGANMSSTNFTKAQIGNCIMNEANLTSAHLNEANLTGTNLTGANMTLTNMTGANLSDTELNGVIVADKNWFTQLDQWHVTGAKEIQHKYKMVDESANDKPKFRLEKIEK